MRVTTFMRYPFVVFLREIPITVAYIEWKQIMTQRSLVLDTGRNTDVILLIFNVVNGMSVM